MLKSTLCGEEESISATLCSFLDFLPGSAHSAILSNMSEIMAGIYPPQCGDYSLIVMLHHLTPEPADDFCSTLQCCMPGPSVTKCSLWPLYGHPTP